MGALSYSTCTRNACALGYFWGMYENSKRYKAGQQAAQYLPTAEAVLREAATRAGTHAGVVRTLMQLAAMKASGTQVSAADVGAAEVVSAETVRLHLAIAKRLGWIESRRQKLHILSAGREVVASVARAWERSARHLVSFSSALPYRRRNAKRNEDQA